MTQEQLNALRKLVIYWANSSYCLGNPKYDEGVDTGRNSCANDLELILKYWQSTTQEDSTTD